MNDQEIALQKALQYHRSGHFQVAEALYQKVLEHNPTQPDALHLLGLLAFDRHENTLAHTLIAQAIASLPTIPEYYDSLGKVLTSLGKIEEAISTYQRALELFPKASEIHRHLGTLFLKQGDLCKAKKQFQEAISYQANDANAYFNLGIIDHSLRQFADAVHHFKTALSLKPHWQEARLNLTASYNLLGIQFYQRSQFYQAFEYFQQAIFFSPDCTSAYNNMAVVLNELWRYQEACEVFQRGLTINPQDPDLCSSFFHCLCTMTHITSIERFKSVVQWGNYYDMPVRKAQPMAHVKRLRVGYVSPFFSKHSFSAVFELLYQFHSSETIEIFSYASNCTSDEVTKRCQHLSHHWRSTLELTDQEVVKQIKADKLHILIDLTGHYNALSRLLVFAHKAAPIQITAFNSFTTGLKAIDYRLSDPLMEPPYRARFNTEKIAYLSACLLRWLPPQDSVSLLPPPCLSQGYVTFGCGNQIFKLNPLVITLWAAILRQVPHSCLYLKNSALGVFPVVQKFQAHFASCGVSKDRLLFAGSTDHQQHLSFYNEIDIALDPFPYNGGVTTLESLWMGVPVITLNTGTRVGHSVLSHVGLSDYIALKPVDYVKIAVRLAHDPEALIQFRNTLREQLHTSDLCDGQQFAQDMENLYQMMWEKERIKKI